MFNPKNSHVKRVITVAAVAIVAIVLSACGGGDDTDQQATGNQADAMFVNAMIPHHQGAIDMAKIAKSKSNRDEVLSLADAIITTQAAEIKTLEELQSTLPKTNESMMDSSMMQQMDSDVASLEDAEDFDKAFIAAMIPHHQSAVKMAEMVTENGTNPEVAKLAQAVITAQTDEIEMMQKWNEDWYGEMATTEKTGSMPGH